MFLITPRRLLTVMALTVFLAGVPMSASNSSHDTVRRLKRKVAPVYPILAREMKIEGTVKVEVTIAASGVVKATKVIGGHPLLVRSALDALKSWLYEPGPEEVTVVEFHFDASGSGGDAGGKQ